MLYSTKEVFDVDLYKNLQLAGQIQLGYSF